MKIRKNTNFGKNKFQSNGITVAFNNTTTNTIISPFEHSHEEYELMIVLCPVWLKINDNIFLSEAGYCYCIPSETNHGIIKPFKGMSFIDIKWDKLVFENYLKLFNIPTDFEFKTKFSLAYSLYNLVTYFIEIFNSNSFDKHYKLRRIVDLITIEAFDQLTLSKSIKRVENAFTSTNMSIALKYINENYNKEINITTLAKLCNLSNFYFARSFKSYTTFSPMAYVRKVRVAKAVHYLTNTTLNVGIISKLSGFKTQARLNEAIKKEFGLTPTQLKDKKNIESIVYSKNR